MQIVSNYKTGFYADLSNEAYHADPAISSSGLRMFLELPDLYYQTYLANDRLESDESKAMRIGSYAHIAILEPVLFSKKYTVAPDKFMYTKSKAVGAVLTKLTKNHGYWDECVNEAAQQGKVALTHDEYQQALHMSDALKKDEDIMKFLTAPGVTEGSFFAIDASTQLPVRARPDRLVELPNGEVYIVDYKSVGISLSDKKQTDHAFELERHIQGAHHKAVVELVLKREIAGVLYITQHTKKPYYARIFQLKDEDLEVGSGVFYAALDAISRCCERNNWPSWPKGIQYYGAMPPWIANKNYEGLKID